MDYTLYLCKHVFKELNFDCNKIVKGKIIIGHVVNI